jgi:hypothetical protein
MTIAKQRVHVMRAMHTLPLHPNNNTNDAPNGGRAILRNGEVRLRLIFPSNWF